MTYCKVCGKDIYECLAHRILSPREPHEAKKEDEKDGKDS